MSNKSKNIPQAFPVVVRKPIEIGDQQVGEQDVLIPGLTKRELIASMAMQGLLASYSNCKNPMPEKLAMQSLDYADALLAELEKGGDVN